MNTAKNYLADGGDKTVIGGELVITSGGKMTFAGAELKQSTLQANSVATDAAGLVTDFNALLAKLKAAGIMSSV